MRKQQLFVALLIAIDCRHQDKIDAIYEIIKTMDEETKIQFCLLLAKHSFDISKYFADN